MPITVTNDIFGKNLLFLRKKFRLSRLGLAKLLGTAEVLIKLWETCQVYPTLATDTVKRICVIFQTDKHSLLYTDFSGDQ